MLKMRTMKNGCIRADLDYENSVKYLFLLYKQASFEVMLVLSNKNAVSLLLSPLSSFFSVTESTAT